MDLMQELAAVALVLGLLGAMLWALRRRGFASVLPARRAGGRRLECVERLGLGPQHALHLVRMGDRGLLVASSPSGCSLVESFSWREAEAMREGSR